MAERSGSVSIHEVPEEEWQEGVGSGAVSQTSGGAALQHGRPLTRGRLLRWRVLARLLRSKAAAFYGYYVSVAGIY